MTDSLSIIEAEAALCSWEWMNDRYNQRDHSEGPVFDMCLLWGEVGTSAMRHIAIGLGPAINDFYLEMTMCYGEAATRARFQAYDFDFVPEVLSRLDWGNEMRSIAGGIGPIALSDQAEVEVEFEIWRLIATNTAGREYGYAEYVSENEDEAIRAFVSGEHPKEYIERIAVRHGFSEVDDITRVSTARRFPDYDNDALRAYRAARFAVDVVETMQAAP